MVILLILNYLDYFKFVLLDDFQLEEWDLSFIVGFGQRYYFLNCQEGYEVKIGVFGKEKR